jgi:hypothetical protein
VGAGGGVADHQRPGDLAVGEALGHQHQHPTLAGGQRIHRPRLRGHQRPRQLPGGHRAQVHPPARAARTAAATSSAAASLGRYPAAPARRAPWTMAAWVELVTATTCISG